MDSEKEFKQRQKRRLVDRMHKADAKEARRLAIIIYRKFYCNCNTDGAEGSGNWGHEGRPGEQGGSKGGGGAHNRFTLSGRGYTSFSKMKKEVADYHPASSDELGKLSNDSKIWARDDLGNEYVLIKSKYFQYFDKMDPNTGEIIDEDISASSIAKDGYEIKYCIPDDANPNFNISRTEDAKELNERFSNAISYGDEWDYDNDYREISGDVWSDADEDTREALYDYTADGYISINECLRTQSYDDGRRAYEADLISDAISQCTLTDDTVLYRGVYVSDFEKMFGLPAGALREDNCELLAGITGCDMGFMSAGSVEGTGFTDKKVQLEIMAPAGTQAMYVEPFSAHGSGDGIYWDGYSEQYSFSPELETLLQCGTSVAIVSGQYDSYRNQYKFKLQVTGQDPKIPDYDYEPRFSYGGYDDWDDEDDDYEDYDW